MLLVLICPFQQTAPFSPSGGSWCLGLGSRWGWAGRGAPQPSLPGLLARLALFKLRDGAWERNKQGKIHHCGVQAFSAAVHFFISSIHCSDLLGCHALIICLGQLNCQVSGEQGCLTLDLLGIVFLQAIVGSGSGEARRGSPAYPMMKT